MSTAVEPALALLVAAVVCYVSPRGFWLWGLAVVSLRPVAEVLETIYFHYFTYPSTSLAEFAETS
jgi:hypothetical protein